MVDAKSITVGNDIIYVGLDQWDNILKKIDKSHKKYKLLKLNDYELNSLSYEFAIKIDERTFFNTNKRRNTT